MVCAVVKEHEKLSNYSYDTSKEEYLMPGLIDNWSIDSSFNDDLIPNLIERQFNNSSSDEDESTMSGTYSPTGHNQNIPINHAMRPNTRDVVIQGRILN